MSSENIWIMLNNSEASEHERSADFPQLSSFRKNSNAWNVRSWRIQYFGRNLVLKNMKLIGTCIHINAHIHTRIYMCVFAYICVYVYVCVYIYAHVYIYTYVCMYMYIHTCMCGHYVPLLGNNKNITQQTKLFSTKPRPPPRRPKIFNSICSSDPTLSAPPRQLLPTHPSPFFFSHPNNPAGILWSDPISPPSATFAPLLHPLRPPLSPPNPPHRGGAGGSV